jgi:hypothetical protein
MLCLVPRIAVSVLPAGQSSMSISCARPIAAITRNWSHQTFMMRPQQLLVVGLAFLLTQPLPPCHAQAGGVPPKKVTTKLCSISSVRAPLERLEHTAVLCCGSNTGGYCCLPWEAWRHEGALVLCAVMAVQVFGKLLSVKTAPACRAGCVGGKCPVDWMPSTRDRCSAPCGKIFEVRLTRQR